ncbi:hypothetical protein AYO44_01440 [Planctomycetaceae bacterium SCGC AG-212-F19]|nr:hypothetical protein AYO44_01440 [Planctomycetaceae bacterium SCGC AG-212-F19]
METLPANADPKSRHPDWRWAVAVVLVTGAAPVPRIGSDRAIRAARQFYAAWRRCRGEGDHRVLAARMPCMAQAFELHEYGGPVRAALEARILARETLERIAAKAALPMAVVCCYQEVFFDVSARLGSPDYVLTYLLPSVANAATACDYDVLWKWFGYTGGSAVLDEVIGTIGPGAQPHTFAQVETYLTETARRGVRRQLAMAARSLLPGDPRTAAALLRLFTPAPEPPEGAAASERMVELMISGMLDEFPWTAGRREQKDNLNPGLAPYAHGHMEPRDHEVMALLAGLPPPPELQAAVNVVMPPPPPKPPGQGPSSPTELPSPAPPPPPGKPNPKGKGPPPGGRPIKPH